MESEPGTGSQSTCTTRRLSAAAGLSTRRLPATTKLSAAIWYSFYSYTQCEWSYFNGHGCQCCSWTKLPVFNCRRTDFLLRRETESLRTFSCDAINSL